MITHPKLKVLAEMEGISIERLLALATSDSVVTGICIARNCNGTADVEPDCTDGYCEDCKGHTIQSPLMLAGMI